MKQKPVCETVFPWLKANLGHCLGGLTGADYRALQAAVQIINLYAYTGGGDAIRAFGLVVGQMQEKERELAYHAIAHVLDWGDRGKIWLRAGLPRLDAVRVCAHEPGGVRRYTEGGAA
jgi:hypothetical protein